jgi:transcriptional regulator with XRE-family HTH domain
MIAVYFYIMTMNEKIRTLRKSKGWTQIELAEKLGTSQKAVTTYETGTRRPSLDRLTLLARLFNVTLEDLIGKNGIKPQEDKKHVHKNSRVAQIQVLYERLPANEQRVILKQVKNLVEHD